ncbi:MAG: C39 family peptidase [Chloroflexota bacterium]|nr:C39 family peptidase [Chloroflexota bacterium]
MIRSTRQSMIIRCIMSTGMLLGAVLVLPAMSQQVHAAKDEAVIAGFPSVSQWYSLDCEYAAAAAVTLYWGNVVSQRDFVREVPSSPDPHLGFRGDIDGPVGGMDDYGVYAEALIPVLEAHGYNAVAFYGGVSRLKANVAAGNPVVVWITTGKNIERSVLHESYNGDKFKLVPGEHSVVVYGYDPDGVRLMDVGNGSFYYTDWTSFLRRWSYFDQMALVITP